jgi:hypothetical protein
MEHFQETSGIILNSTDENSHCEMLSVLLTHIVHILTLLVFINFIHFNTFLFMSALWSLFKLLLLKFPNRCIGEKIPVIKTAFINHLGVVEFSSMLFESTVEMRHAINWRLRDVVIKGFPCLRCLIRLRSHDSEGQMFVTY